MRARGKRKSTENVMVFIYASDFVDIQLYTIKNTSSAN